VSGESRDPDDILARPAPPPDLVLRYGPDREHVVDVRLPANGRRPAPLVVMLHGGFWQAGYDRRHTGPMCADLAARGYAVATPEYRRVGQPGGGWPGTFDDVAAALDALPSLLAEAAPAGIIDDRAPVLAGHSAGGHLALWSAGRHRLPADCPWYRSSPLPLTGVLSLAGVCDLAQASAMGLGDHAADGLLGGPASDRPDRVAVTSPAALVPLGVRLALVHGTDDDRVPVRVSEDFTVRARRVGDDVRLATVPGVDHFALIDPLSDAWPAVVDVLAGLT